MGQRVEQPGLEYRVLLYYRSCGSGGDSGARLCQALTPTPGHTLESRRERPRCSPPSRLIQVDDAGQLFISPALEDLGARRRIGHRRRHRSGRRSRRCYSYPLQRLPLHLLSDHRRQPGDTPLRTPRLRAIARLGASLIAGATASCRTAAWALTAPALVAGLIMIELRTPGAAVVERLRERQPGALIQ